MEQARSGVRRVTKDMPEFLYRKRKGNKHMLSPTNDLVSHERKEKKRLQKETDALRKALSSSSFPAKRVGKLESEFNQR